MVNSPSCLTDKYFIQGFQVVVYRPGTGVYSKRMFWESRMGWFTSGVTLFLIVVCNALLMGGLWVSGVDLEFVLAKSDLYDPQNGHCVRVVWAQVRGVDGLIQVCSEWLDTTDLTGKVHLLRLDEPLAMGEDGNLYYERLRETDYRLLGLILYTIVVIVSGMCMKHRLIGWYRSRFYRPEPDRVESPSH